MNRIPVVDLFAGPGGLSEGFSSINGDLRFDVVLSLEKDCSSHRTLELRSFFRVFRDSVPDEYYQYLSGQISRQVLFDHYPCEASEARKRAWLAELGSIELTDSVLNERIRKAVPDRESPWVLIGGPPCQAYSLAGRSRLKGISLERYESDNRHYLYRQYLKILAIHRPHIFVMENVKGILSAEVSDTRIMQQILDDLEAPNNGGDSDSPRYDLFPLTPSSSVFPGSTAPSDFVIRSEEFGVPQRRHRVIILGIRRDIHKSPSFLFPAPNQVAFKDVVSDLPPLRSGVSRQEDSWTSWASTIRSAAESPWFKESGIDPEVRSIIMQIQASLRTDLGRGSEFIPGSPSPAMYKDWFADKRLTGFCNHSSRSHMDSDLHRYLFAAAYARHHRKSPTLNSFPEKLLPKHRNVSAALNGSRFNDRFRVQILGQPATTVTCHIGKDGHYYIHPDPSQCRSLTVREAARLQTFPDNYFFEGTRTDQYRQVGNAVPVLLARQIAEIVGKVLSDD